MSLYEPVERWSVPESLIAMSIQEMAPDGLKGCEGIVLWLGRVSGGVATVQHLVGLTGPLILKLPDHLRIDPDLFNQVAQFSEARDLTLVGQIHSHPGTFVDLSYADITYGVSAPHYLSVVAPHFAQDSGSRWKDCGVHVYEAKRGFRRLRADEVAKRIQRSQVADVPLTRLGG